MANVPIFVDGPAKEDSGIKASMPLKLYSDNSADMPFAPLGWMGNTGALSADWACMDNPRSGKACAKISYSSGEAWAGIACQFPPNDWGDQPQGLDVSGAKKLTFWMRGAEGGEKVKVELGIIKKDKKYFDTGSGSLELVLTRDWKQYSIELAGKDLTRIKTGFVITLAGAGKPLTIYFDDVQFE